MKQLLDTRQFVVLLRGCPRHTAEIGGGPLELDRVDF
jgi:hypothetical protein